MNWVLISVIGIFAVCAIQGYRKGIIKIGVSLASMIISIIACVFITPAICTTIKSETTIHEKMTESVYSMIIKSDLYSEAYDEAVDDGLEEIGITEESFVGYKQQIGGYMEQIAELMKLPASVFDEYESVISSDSVVNLLSEKTLDVKNFIALAVSSRLADMAINSVVYIAVFAVTYIILKIILMATGIIASLPLIRQANKTVGMLFGLLEALVVVWLLFAVITACSNFEWAGHALAMIGDNVFLEFLYDKNVIIKTILKVA